MFREKIKLKGRSQVDFMTNLDHVFRIFIALLDLLVPTLEM